MSLGVTETGIGELRVCVVSGTAKTLVVILEKGLETKDPLTFESEFCFLSDQYHSTKGQTKE